MNDFQQSLERFFDRGSALLAEISRRWKKHANRRTALALLFGGTSLVALYTEVVRPPDGFPINVLVAVPQGATLSEAADSLEKDGVIRSGFALKLLLALAGKQDDVHAGDYLFKEPKNMFAVARAIITGAYGLEPFRIRVPEGAMAREMAKMFGAFLERFDAERFLERAEPQEGYLFPDTYFFLPNATDELVLLTMRQNFNDRIEEASTTIAASGRSLKDIVIMASLLEREARATEDRRMISGVLWNRLDRGMLLQVDAAFLYTLGKGTFQLTKEDLQSDSPYNTYRYKGLPPTPIGSPSLDSIIAAATPIKHGYLYYLADGNHVTHYSRTYEEHLRLKRKYLGS